MHGNPVYQTIENWIEVGKEMDLIRHIIWGGGGDSMSDPVIDR